MLLLLIFAPAVLLASTPVEESSSAFEIQGVVLDSGTLGPSAELSEQIVRLIAVEGTAQRFREVDRVTTDSNGRFRFQASRPPTETHFNRLSYLVLATLPDGGFGETHVRELTRPDNLTIRVARKTALLRGRVVDEEGNAVADAHIRYSLLSGETLDGLPETTTNENGLFLLPRLPAIDGTRGQPGSITLCLDHSRYPRTFVRIHKCPDIRTITLQPGCELTGSVTLNEDAPLDGLEVIAVRNDPIPDGTTQHQNVHALTDELGHFRMVVPPGRYHLQLNEDEKWVAPALMNIQCPPETSKSLPPLVAGRGSWIEGTVVNSVSESPLARTPEGALLQIGLEGPHRPRGNPQRPIPLCTVDPEGRFRLRVAPGRQFPYLLHPDGERTIWNTREQPPVTVLDSEQAEVELSFRPHRSASELYDETMTFLDQLPENSEERTRSIVRRLRQYNFITHEADAWAPLLRELILIGSPAVPHICEELETTGQQRMLRRLVFALRGINDPNCVPTLIRILPRTLQRSISPSELSVDDRTLLEFMSRRDCSNEVFSSTFQLAPPLQEVLSALETMTQHSEETSCLTKLHLSSDDHANVFATARFAQAATNWASWWNANSDQFSIDPLNRTVALIPTPMIDVESVPFDGKLSSDAEGGPLYRSLWLNPVTATNRADCFFDLDTRCVISAPADLKFDTHDPTSLQTLIQWGRDHGADIVCLMTTTTDGRETPSLKLIDSRAWEIGTPADQMARWINVGQLPTGRPVDELLHSRESDSDVLTTRENSNFLCLTSEKGLGVITLNLVQSREANAGHWHQVRIGFDLAVIYR
ncbi:carboxypeptidase-like regulatory domain-containing protein [Thalassoglobus sp. JC818]|uniref:carboxypeptidase-like regulatory domain-containing protein n=1 Tax=Thalassoglobus sp. JC818 TaxID=3232136 RepID=UPI003459618B